MTARHHRPAARPGHTQPALEEPTVTTDRPYTDDDLIAEAARHLDRREQDAIRRELDTIGGAQ